jgi:hypothetical protein
MSQGLLKLLFLFLVGEKKTRMFSRFRFKQKNGFQLGGLASKSFFEIHTAREVAWTVTGMWWLTLLGAGSRDQHPCVV